MKKLFTTGFAVLAIVFALAIGTLQPVKAQASIGPVSRLQPGTSNCVSALAAYRVYAQGNATNPGARFDVYNNGVRIYRSQTNTITAFAYQVFPAAGGIYMACVTNTGISPITAQLTLWTDNNIPYPY